MTQPMRKKQRVRALLHERLGIALHQLELNQSSGHFYRCFQMKLFPFGARHTTRYCILLSFQDETEQLTLKMCRFASCNKGACHICDVAIYPGTRVDQNKLPAPD